MGSLQFSNATFASLPSQEFFIVEDQHPVVNPALDLSTPGIRPPLAGRNSVFHRDGENYNTYGFNNFMVATPFGGRIWRDRFSTGTWAPGTGEGVTSSYVLEYFIDSGGNVASTLAGVVNREGFGWSQAYSHACAEMGAEWSALKPVFFPSPTHIGFPSASKADETQFMTTNDGNRSDSIFITSPPNGAGTLSSSSKNKFTAINRSGERLRLVAVANLRDSPAGLTTILMDIDSGDLYAHAAGGAGASGVPHAMFGIPSSFSYAYSGSSTIEAVLRLYNFGTLLSETTVLSTTSQTGTVALPSVDLTNVTHWDITIPYTSPVFSILYPEPCYNPIHGAQNYITELDGAKILGRAVPITALP